MRELPSITNRDEPSRAAWIAAAPVGQLVTIITAHLPSHTRSGIGLSAHHDRYEGHFHRLALTSVFQPILSAVDGATIGHEGFVRAGADRQLSPWSMFSRAAASADPDWLVALDRLCRALHAANYFPHADDHWRLFLNVQAGLVSAVARDHGAVFAGILRLLGVSPERVVIQLPAGINDEPNHLRAAAQSFLARGFGLAINFSGGASVLLASTLAASGATPVIVKIDAAALPATTPLPQLVADCRRRGLATLIKRIGTADAATTAIEAGADLIQGFAFGQPEAPPRSGWRHS